MNHPKEDIIKIIRKLWKDHMDAGQKLRTENSQRMH